MYSNTPSERTKIDRVKANNDSPSGQVCFRVCNEWEKGENQKERKKESQNPPSFPPSQTWVFSIRFEMLGNMGPNLKFKQASIVALE